MADAEADSPRRAGIEERRVGIAGGHCPNRRSRIATAPRVEQIGARQFSLSPPWPRAKRRVNRFQGAVQRGLSRRGGRHRQRRARPQNSVRQQGARRQGAVRLRQHDLRRTDAGQHCDPLSLCPACCVKNHDLIAQAEQSEHAQAKQSCDRKGGGASPRPLVPHAS